MRTKSVSALLGAKAGTWWCNSARAVFTLLRPSVSETQWWAGQGAVITASEGVFASGMENKALMEWTGTGTRFQHMLAGSVGVRGPTLALDTLR